MGNGVNRRVLFITGGSRGIGAGVVAAAARQGYDVAFTYRELPVEYRLSLVNTARHEYWAEIGA